MDCDQVFMILTRGPFPTGEPWDEEVESHLERCADCWRLAEALRPALEIFQEAVPPSEGQRLAGLIPGARLLTLPGLGHLAHEEQPARIAELVREMLPRTAAA